MAADGGDLPAAVATIFEIGMKEDFKAALQDAFPGAELAVEIREGYFELFMFQPGLSRPLPMAALSDGTLRYLLLLTALLSPRPPAFMVLNEPEMSLHSDLLPPLGRLIVKASERGQVIVVSHSAELVVALGEAGCPSHVQLEKPFGDTRAVGHEEPRWEWPSR